jgi:inversin
MASRRGGKDTLFVKMLLAYQADPNVRDKEGKSPLHIACGLGYRDVVALLLATGADVNAKIEGGQFDRMTPLLFAIDMRHDDVAELLKQHGAKAFVR